MTLPSSPATATADVAVVGYGPVGQTLALKLAQAGHDVVVLERQTSLYGLPRAVGLDYEAMRILQSVGVMDELAPSTCLTPAYEWRNERGELLVAFPGLDQMSASGWPNGCTFNQPMLERLLDTRIRNDHPGQIRVLTGQAVVGLAEDADGVSLDVQTGSGAYTVRARFAVGCDGAGSFVRSAIGSTLQDLSFSGDWLVVDVHPHDPALCDSRLVQICDPARPTTMVAGGRGRRRFEFMLVEGEVKENFNNPELAWSLLERWGWTPQNAHLERHAVYTFRAAIADSWRRGRVLLAGDAAHLTPPFAAQGLCGGLRDVAALAWRLDLVLRNLASQQLFDSYAPERASAIRPFIEFAVGLGRLSCLRDAAERDRALHAAQAAGSRFPAPPLGSSCLQRSGDQVSGTLSIQGRVRHRGRTVRFDDLPLGSGFVLIGRNIDPTTRLTPEQRSFMQTIGATCLGIGMNCAFQDIDGAYHRWFEQLGQPAVLVRPDFYLYGAGDPSALVSDLMQAWHRFKLD